MSDLISRSKLIQHLNDWALQEAPFRDMKHNLTYNAIQECIKAVEEQPIVEAVSVVHGEWVGDYSKCSTKTFQYDDWSCSRCGMYYPMRNKKLLGNFCPECGADIRKKQ